MSNVTLRKPVWIQSVQDPVASISVAPDGATLGVLTTEGPIGLFETRSGTVTGRRAGHEGGGFQLAWHPTDKSLVASSGQDGRVRFWSPDDETHASGFEAGNAWVENLAWSPSGHMLAATAGRKLQLWSHATKQLHHTLADHKSTLSALDWRRDGKAVAVTCYGMARLYLPESGTVAESLPWKTSLISLALSPDNRWIAAGTQEQSVQIWELPFHPGEELAMSGYPGKVRELAWHFSGKYLATGGSDQVMVWNCSGSGPAGTEPTLLEGHAERIAVLKYQAKGHLLASGGTDGRVYLWNARKSVAPLAGFEVPAPVTQLMWTPDDQQVVFGCRDGSIGLLAVPSF